MKYDYYGICDCRWEHGEVKLAEMKKESYKHLFSRCPLSKEKPRVFINRNFRNSDIDDSFNDLIITREQAIHYFNANVLGSFFAGVKA